MNTTIEILRIVHIPQIPGAAYKVLVGSMDEAVKVRSILYDYDLFQFDNNIKPDYCNMCDLEVFEDGEWISWYHPETDIGFDEHCRSL